MTRDEDNARRLVGVLKRYADDLQAVQQIAAALNYHAPQLREDMESLHRWMCLKTKGREKTGDGVKQLGARIREARKRAKLSQTELANRLGKTLRTVQKYESGEIEPSISTALSIASILRVSLAELVEA